MKVRCECVDTPRWDLILHVHDEGNKNAIFNNDMRL
jgi:hypothetical protein